MFSVTLKKPGRFKQENHTLSTIQPVNEHYLRPFSCLTFMGTKYAGDLAFQRKDRHKQPACRRPTPIHCKKYEKETVTHKPQNQRVAFPCQVLAPTSPGFDVSAVLLGGNFWPLRSTGGYNKLGLWSPHEQPARHFYPRASGPSSVPGTEQVLNKGWNRWPAFQVCILHPIPKSYEIVYSATYTSKT